MHIASRDITWLYVSLLLCVLCTGQTTEEELNAFDLLQKMKEENSDYDYRAADYDISSFLDVNDANDTRETILVSYLGAVSQFGSSLFDSIRKVSEVNSNEISSKINIDKLSKCFRFFEGSTISGALQVAIDDVNYNSSLLPNHKLTYIFNNTCGDEMRSTEYFMEHWKKGAKVFIGPETHCKTEATMAAAQNLPIISYKCKDQTVSDKKKYPTFARTVPAETEITKSFLALMKYFKWRKFTVIYEKQPANEELFSAIKRAIESENEKFDHTEQKYTILNISIVEYPFSEVVDEVNTNVHQIISETFPTTRIYLTFGNVRLFRRILLEMGGMGLMDNREYVLIYLDTDYNWYNVYHAMNNHFFRDTLIGISQSWDMPNSQDRQVVNYSRTALAIIPTPVILDSPIFTEFWRKANHYLARFGVQQGKESRSGIKANRFACYLYDAVMLYARALHELMMETNSTAEAAISSGSMQGFDMRIDENGDAQGNYTLLSLQHVEPVLNKSDPDYYPLDMALTVSADFIADNDASALPQLRFQGDISWPSGKIPLDEPECGFFNELCNEDNTKYSIVIGSILFSIIAIALISAFVTYR
ncbi:receptor family ligand binding region domain-containing protein [Ditylenchus destructor]|uniref:Receptor family ligand binding region domain-containing protein n=1 Tax=Ditylenchus destructor TaxID=166010 RepID=A0AAD4N8R1_9BILA|nr:receptor family ligand binding region domain-containing protein [Ditylenchus destructor]